MNKQKFILFSLLYKSLNDNEEENRLKKNSGNRTMKKLILLVSAYMTFSVFMPSAYAVNTERATVLDEYGISFNSDDGVTMPVWEGKKEDGIIQFYMQPTTGVGVEYSFSPDNLNNIEPAAGIQFKMDLDF